LDDEAGEEGDGVEVGFGFGDGYDFRAASGTREAFLETCSSKSTSTSAVEADAVKVIWEPAIICEDNMAIVGSVDAIPVPDGQRGVGSPRPNAAEAEDASKAVEVDDRVGAEGEESDGFIKGAIKGQCAAEVDISVVVDGIGSRDEEGAAVDIDDRAVAEGVGGGSGESARVDGGGACVSVCRIQSGSAATVLGEGAGGGCYRSADRGISRSGEGEVLGAGNATGEGECACI
jgi:hypothetical protein